MFNKYVYDIGCFDNKLGTTKLKDYILLSELYSQEGCFSDYMVREKIKKFLIECFMAVFTTENHWEGDVRGDEIAISAIPNSNGESPCRILAFKQDNNGSSWMVSELYFDRPV